MNRKFLNNNKKRKKQVNTRLGSQRKDGEPREFVSEPKNWSLLLLSVGAMAVELGGLFSKDEPCRAGVCCSQDLSLP